MLSFGMAAFTVEKELVGTFSRNLELLDGAGLDDRTMQWWGTNENIGAYYLSREDLVTPQTAMLECKAWLEEMRRFGKPIICGAPSGFDFTFIYYYFQRELGESTVGFASLDLRSYAAAVLKRQYRQVGKNSYRSGSTRGFRTRTSRWTMRSSRAVSSSTSSERTWDSRTFPA